MLVLCIIVAANTIPLVSLMRLNNSRIRALVDTAELTYDQIIFLQTRGKIRTILTEGDMHEGLVPLTLNEVLPYALHYKSVKLLKNK